MKRIIAVLLTALLTVALFGSCSQGKDEYDNGLDKILSTGEMVISVSPDFAPMEFIDSTKTGDDQYVGFDITLANYIADELGVKLVIEAMDFTACQAAVSEGTVDMSISGYSKTDERAENFDFSDFYYAGDNESEQCILILAENADKFKTAEDFTGKDVAAQNASLQYNLLTSQLPDATPVPIVDLSTAVLEVINGKVDALCVAKGNGESFIANYPELALSDFQFTIEDEGNVVLLPKGETELQTRINEILAKAYEAGLYGQWYDDAYNLAVTINADM